MKYDFHLGFKIDFLVGVICGIGVLDLHWFDEVFKDRFVNDYFEDFKSSMYI